MEETLWGEAVRFMKFPAPVRLAGIRQWWGIRSSIDLYTLGKQLEGNRRVPLSPDSENKATHLTPAFPSRKPRT
jgi:hypothetical protein